jgi:hypothetical protein
MPIDLDGQGEPLPQDFPYKGDWMLKPRIFLYVPDEPTSVAPSVPQFTVSLNTLQEDWSFGFDVTHIAAAFETTADAILIANRRGDLTLENVLANTPDGKNATAKIYVIGFDGETIDMTIEMLSQAGRG